jgi:hypothetical protein
MAGDRRDDGGYPYGGRATAVVEPTCAKDGVCFTKTIKGATKTITVTGTAGNDKIVLSNVAALGNNSRSTIGVNGVKTNVDATHDAILVVNGLGTDSAQKDAIDKADGLEG